MNDQGKWIKLHSKILNWEWYKDINTKTLFIHCLLKANWKDGKFRGKNIPRGSFVTSLETLSKETGLSIQQVRTSIKHLILTKELTNQSFTQYRIITVVNYELYQQVNKESNNQLTDEQQTTNNQLTTIEEYKNIEDIISCINNKYARDVYPFEYEKIENWIEKLSADLVGFAIDISVVNNVKKLNYVEGILRNWLNAGYKTRKDILDNERKNEKEEEPVELFDYDWINETEE